MPKHKAPKQTILPKSTVTAAAVVQAGVSTGSAASLTRSEPPLNSSRLLFFIIAAIFLATLPAWALTVYDLNPAATAPVLPTNIDVDMSPVFITNQNPDNLSGSGEVDTLRVGDHARLSLGFSKTAAYDSAVTSATGAVTLKVNNDAAIHGKTFVGRDPALGGSFYQTNLNVMGNLAVNQGGALELHGYADGGGSGGDPNKHAAASAQTVNITGGSLVLGDFSTLTTTLTGNSNTYSLTLQNGGALILNGGPHPTDDPTWVRKGLILTNGGGGISVSSGGVLGAGAKGGVIVGTATQNIDIASGGTLDAGLGNLYVEGIGGINFDGSYRVGRAGAGVTTLTALNSVVNFASGSSIGLTRDLSRYLNGNNLGANGLTLLTAKEITGILPASFRTGMGTYNLAWTNPIPLIIEEPGEEPGTEEPGTVTEPGDDTGNDPGGGIGDDIGGDTVNDTGDDTGNDIGEDPGDTTGSDTGPQPEPGGDSGDDDPPVTAPVILAGGQDDESDGGEIVPFSDPVPATLTLTRVDGGVTGDRSAADYENFGKNMANIWANGGAMARGQTDLIYNLIAAEEKNVDVSGPAGELNRAVLGAFVDGKGAAIEGTGGYADSGLFEMYDGAAQYGPNTAAYNTTDRFMDALFHRSELLGAEMDRLGENWPQDVVGVGYANASLCPPDPCAPDKERLNRVWAGGFGADEDASLEYGISGYTYKPRGFILGYDRAVGAFTLGAAVAHQQGDYTDKAATANDSKISGYMGGIYGSYHAQNGLNVSAQAVYSQYDNQLSDQRGGLRRTADFDSHSWAVGAKLGYDMAVGNRLTLSPSIGIEKIRAVSKEHTESLSDTSVLQIGSLKRDSLMVPLDLSVGFDIVRNPRHLLRLTGNAGYAHDFENGGLDGTLTYQGLSGAGANAVGVVEADPGQARYNLGAGLIYTGKRFDVSARYDWYQRANQTTRQARGDIGVKF